MSGAALLKNEINKFKVNELIFVNELYDSKFKDIMSELSFYKAIERLCYKKILIKVAKSIYSRPEVTKYGILGPSENDIVSTFIDNYKGLVIGYTLYNRLKLTTQVSNNIVILSNNIKASTKKLDNVFVKKIDFKINDKIQTILEGLDVLENYNKIQEVNNLNFVIFTKKIASNYEEKCFEYVLNNCNEIKVKKSTIAFYREVLNYYNVANSLDRYLSPLSKYNFPSMEKIYETL